MPDTTRVKHARVQRLVLFQAIPKLAATRFVLVADTEEAVDALSHLYDLLALGDIHTSTTLCVRGQALRRR